MVQATPSSAEPEQARQGLPCLQCFIKLQRLLPGQQATSRT